MGRSARQGAPRAGAPRASASALGLYANLRPVRVHPALAAASPLKPERVEGVDILFVRELTGGLYFGKPRLREKVGDRTRAVDTLEYTDEEIRRVVRLAFRLARGRRKLVTSVDKANVLESSRLWREVADRGRAAKYAERARSSTSSSTRARCASSRRRASFDVVVTENMFGDILTDEAAVLAGSLGLLPSASLGDGTRGLYEPIHGSAPDIAGKGIANPLGTIIERGDAPAPLARPRGRGARRRARGRRGHHRGRPHGRHGRRQADLHGRDGRGGARATVGRPSRACWAIGSRGTGHPHARDERSALEGRVLIPRGTSDRHWRYVSSSRAVAFAPSCGANATACAPHPRGALGSRTHVR